MTWSTVALVVAASCVLLAVACVIAIASIQSRARELARKVSADADHLRSAILGIQRLEWNPEDADAGIGVSSDYADGWNDLRQFIRAEVDPCADLLSFADGGLSSDRKIRFESHLSGCRGCRDGLPGAMEFVRRLSVLRVADPASDGVDGG